MQVPRHTPQHSRAKKSLGQNFLVDPHYRRQLMTQVDRALQLMFPKSQRGPILEIGPGHGVLSGELAERATHLNLVEKDHELAAALQVTFANHPNVSVHSADFLEWSALRALSQPHLVVANLPYNVASQILFRLFDWPQIFPRLLLMFQKEVALRCVALPDTSEYGLLSVWSQVYSEPRILFDLPPAAFRPRPRVDSSFVEFRARGVDPENERPFILFVKKLFSQRRKQLGNVLKAFFSAAVLDRLALPERDWLKRRAETLTISEMRQLYAVLTGRCPG